MSTASSTTSCNGSNIYNNYNYFYNCGTFCARRLRPLVLSVTDKQTEALALCSSSSTATPTLPTRPGRRQHLQHVVNILQQRRGATWLGWLRAAAEGEAGFVLACGIWLIRRIWCFHKALTPWVSQIGSVTFICNTFNTSDYPTDKQTF